MTRQVQRTAAKDYPNEGIKKGDQYWFAKIKTGPQSSFTIRSKTPISRSRLTSSEFLATAYDISDCIADAETVDDLKQCKDDLEALRDETREKFDNLPEGLQAGPTGELLEERVQKCEDLLSELENAIDALDEDEDEPESERVKRAVEDHVSSLF